jgi:hypothetical protein
MVRRALFVALILSVSVAGIVRAQDQKTKASIAAENAVRGYLQSSAGLTEPLLSCVAHASTTLQTGHVPFDRFSSSKEAYAAASVETWKKAFTETDKQKVDSVVSVAGRARAAADGTTWHDVTVRCGIKSSKLAAFEVVDHGAVKGK